MLKHLARLLDIADDENLRHTLIEGFETIFEANYWNPKTAVNTSSMMGDYKNIMKQVGVGVVGGNGMMMDKSSLSNATTTMKVPANPSTMRDPGEETREQWESPKKAPAPLQANSPAFVKTAIQASSTHMPKQAEVGIPSAQRRFAMIYPTLSTGINSALPRLT